MELLPESVDLVIWLDAGETVEIVSDPAHCEADPSMHVQWTSAGIFRVELDDQPEV